MTTITRERVAEIIHAAGLEPCDYEEVFGSIKTGEIVAMARIALASLEAESVGFIARHKETGEFGSYLHPKADWFKNDNYEVLSAYTAPPAPKVTFYRDGIEAAAAWVDKQREEYDNEHGRHDPDTGSFEFGNDVQRDYSATLEEIAEGIRALHPNTAPPVPDNEMGRNPVLAYADSYRDMAKQGVESIPVWSVITDLERNIAPLYAATPATVVMDEAQSRELFEKWCSMNIERNKWHPGHYAHLPAREQWDAWESCRAAMLNQGRNNG